MNRIEPTRLERTFQIIKSNCYPSTSNTTTEPCSSSSVELDQCLHCQTCPFHTFPFHHHSAYQSRAWTVFWGLNLQLYPCAGNSHSATVSRMQPKAKGKLPAPGTTAPTPASCMDAAGYCSTSLIPAKRDPKTSGRGWFAPRFLPGVLVTGFVAPSSVCQVNCIGGSQLSGPQVRQSLALYHTQYEAVDAFKARMRSGKAPSRCSPICFPTGKTIGVKGGSVQSRNLLDLLELICCQGTPSHRSHCPSVPIDSDGQTVKVSVITAA